MMMGLFPPESNRYQLATIMPSCHNGHQGPDLVAGLVIDDGQNGKSTDNCGQLGRCCGWENPGKILEMPISNKCLNGTDEQLSKSSRIILFILFINRPLDIIPKYPK